MGSSFVSVPQFNCSLCGDFEMSPAAVGCQRGSPYPAVWYDPWLCATADEFGTSGGVATAIFCACLNAVAERWERLSAEPRVVHSISEKSLAGAVRHWTYVQREYASPAQHGADIFAGPMGKCPPCSGALLAAGETAAVPQEVAPVAVPLPLAALPRLQSAASSEQPGAAGNGLPSGAAELAELGDPSEPQLAALLEAEEAPGSEAGAVTSSAGGGGVDGASAAGDAAVSSLAAGAAAGQLAAGQGAGLQGPAAAVRAGLGALKGLSRPFRLVRSVRGACACMCPPPSNLMSGNGA